MSIRPLFPCDDCLATVNQIFTFSIVMDLHISSDTRQSLNSTCQVPMFQMLVVGTHTYIHINEMWFVNYFQENICATYRSFKALGVRT